jgi:hypothetical protein
MNKLLLRKAVGEAYGTFFAFSIHAGMDSPPPATSIIWLTILEFPGRGNPKVDNRYPRSVHWFREKSGSVLTAATSYHLRLPLEKPGPNCSTGGLLTGLQLGISSAISSQAGKWECGAKSSALDNQHRLRGPLLLAEQRLRNKSHGQDRLGLGYRPGAMRAQGFAMSGGR